MTATPSGSGPGTSSSCRRKADAKSFDQARHVYECEWKKAMRLRSLRNNKCKTPSFSIRKQIMEGIPYVNMLLSHPLSAKPCFQISSYFLALLDSCLITALSVCLASSNIIFLKGRRKQLKSGWNCDCKRNGIMNQNNKNDLSRR